MLHKQMLFSIHFPGVTAIVRLGYLYVVRFDDYITITFSKFCFFEYLWR